MSSLVLLFPSLSVPLPVLWGLFQLHQLQLISLLHSCSIVIFSSLAKSRYLSLFSLFFYFHSVVCWDGKVHYSASAPLCWLLLSLVVWLRSGDPSVSQNPREVCASHSLGQILGSGCTIFSYGQIQTFCMTQSPRDLNSFCANLLHSLIIWLIF